MPEEATGANRAAVTRPRPGHADLAGALKYGHDRHPRRARARQRARDGGARRRSARSRGSCSAQFGVEVLSHVTMIGGVGDRRVAGRHGRRIRAIPDDSPLHCADAAVEQQMIAAIDQAKEAGDTLGGAFEVIVTGLPVGLGSYVQWDRKLDGRLAQAMMSIPRDQGGRHRQRAGRRAAARLAHPRRDRAGRRTRRPGIRRSASRGRPTTPAASKAASPTARSCASPAT